MIWFASNLWDLLTKSRKGRTSARRKKTATDAGRPQRSGKPMQLRYDALVSEMKKTHGVRVRKWRTSMTGCAWEVHYVKGGISRLLEAPYPKGPMSCAIFLHEIGHHAIGFGSYKPRCLEEFYAWKWALNMMRDKGFNVTANVEKRMADSLRYAVDKALRRGLKRIPAELLPFLDEKTG